MTETITFDPTHYADIAPGQPDWERAIEIVNTIHERGDFNGKTVEFEFPGPEVDDWDPSLVSKLLLMVERDGITVTQTDSCPYELQRHFTNRVFDPDLVGGWYNPVERTLFFKPDRNTASSIHTLLHEYTHALTVPNNGITKFTEPLYELVAELTTLEILHRLGYDYPGGLAYLVCQLGHLGRYTISDAAEMVQFAVIISETDRAVTKITGDLADLGADIRTPPGLPQIFGLDGIDRDAVQRVGAKCAADAIVDLFKAPSSGTRAGSGESWRSARPGSGRPLSSK